MTSRELDRAVAEALGMTLATTKSSVTGMIYYSLTGAGQTRGLVWCGSEARAWDCCPHYSTDIAAAFGVLEELRRRRLWYTLEADTDGFMLSIILPANDPKLPPWGQAMNEWSAEGTALPEVICTAALKALEDTTR